MLRGRPGGFQQVLLVDAEANDGRLALAILEVDKPRRVIRSVDNEVLEVPKLDRNEGRPRMAGFRIDFRCG